MSTYRQAPLASNTFPSGISYIIGNEAAERFSFYGMRAILVIFMTQHLLGDNGHLTVMSEDDAKGWYTIFYLPFISHRYSAPCSPMAS